MPIGNLGFGSLDSGRQSRGRQSQIEQRRESERESAAFGKLGIAVAVLGFELWRLGIRVGPLGTWESRTWANGQAAQFIYIRVVFFFFKFGAPKFWAVPVGLKPGLNSLQPKAGSAEPTPLSLSRCVCF